MASYQISTPSLIIGPKSMPFQVENEVDEANHDIGTPSTSHIHLILRRTMYHRPSAVSRITKSSEASTVEAFAIIL